MTLPPNEMRRFQRGPENEMFSICSYRKVWQMLPAANKLGILAASVVGHYTGVFRLGRFSLQ